MTRERVAARVPPRLLRHGRLLRPTDARDVYSNPRAEFARLERNGALHRVGTGLFVAVPDDAVGADWIPPLEDVALAVAATGGRQGSAALMGISAARAHGVVPRAVNVAVVAIEHHRRSLTLSDRNARVHFVRRDVGRLDLQRHRTSLGDGWLTTPEQTVLDLIARPGLGGAQDAAEEAIGLLLPRVDTGLLRELAGDQHRRRAIDETLAVQSDGGRRVGD